MKRLSASPLVRRLACLVLTLAVSAALSIGRVHAEGGTPAKTDSSSHCPQQKAPCEAARSMSCCCDAPGTPVSGTPGSLRTSPVGDLTVSAAVDVSAPVLPPRPEFLQRSARFGYHKIPLTVLLSTFLI